MDVGPFTSVSALTIPAGTDLLQTNGYATKGDGGDALYIDDGVANAAYVAAHPLTSTATANGRYFRLLAADRPLKPEWAGAKGDGLTNDHAAFTELSALAAVDGSLHIELARGATYLVGAQTTGGTYYRTEEISLDLANLASVIIRGNGATLKTNGGMLYGSFDPATGLPIDDMTAHLDHRARIPAALSIESCDVVSIEDLILDGNSVEQEIGGTTTTNATEGGHYGLRLVNNLNLTASNTHARNFLLDGVLVQHDGMAEGDDARPHVFDGCTFSNNGRNCSAVTGGIGIDFNTCVCGPVGAPVSGGGTFATAPKAGLDLEPVATVNRCIGFNNCAFIQGAAGNSAWTSSGDTKDVHFSKCLMVGGVLARLSRSTIDRCTVYGYFRDTALATTPSGEELVISNSYLTDQTIGTTPLQTIGGALFFSSAGAGTKLLHSHIELTRSKANMTDFLGDDVTITIKTDTTSVAASSNIVSLGAGQFKNLVVVEAIAANQPVPSYFINTGTALVRRGNLTSPSSYVKWISSGSTGFTGAYDNDPRQPFVQSIASATTATPAFPNDQVNVTAQAAALAIANPTSPVAGWQFVIRIKDNGTARAITYGTQYRAIGVTLPTTTVIGKTLYVRCVWNSTDSKVDVIAVAQEA